mmetsp:Transcript_28434/g.40755  ORF Transcript_28434/g.40755 Transcript_28434/m.40755 type:complete len:199 (+) Transcript_28434:2443-3039(+)
MGTLEHLHLYCEAPDLVDARKFRYANIEQSLTNIYNFAAYQEYDTSLQDTTRQTKLQEDFERTVLQTELLERPICRNSTVVNEKRTQHQAILPRHQIEIFTLLQKLPASKLQEYDDSPLAHRAGLIHSISEDSFSLDTATIIDVNFLGLFPKSLLDVLRRYKNKLKSDLQVELNTSLPVSCLPLSTVLLQFSESSNVF